MAYVGCTPARVTPMPERYIPEQVTQVELAAGQPATVELVFPKGYKLSPDAPHKVISDPAIHYTRSGHSLTFTDTRDGDNAFIDVYFCESETAAICAFHAVEVVFTGAGAEPQATARIPAP